MENFRKSSDQVGLYYQVDSGLFYKVLDVGKSEIEGGGWGFFICKDFAVGQTITVHVGTEFAKGKSSIYSISTGSIVLNCKPWFKGGGGYLGAHLANDPDWKEEGNQRECTLNNARIGQLFELVAITPIIEGEETLFDYNLTDDE